VVAAVSMVALRWVNGEGMRDGGQGEGRSEQGALVRKAHWCGVGRE
jgi:hypothetical protein